MEFAMLNNGIKMPMEGFGVFQVRDKEECKRSVLDAIKSGYRLIDTAASYTNEDAVGEAVKEAVAQGICTREELFITSKMWVQDMQNYETAKAAIDASLNAMGLEYLDLYLLHQAMKDYFSAWRAMEELYEAGKIRAMKYYEVQPEAWAPLGGGRYKPFDDPMLQKIAAAHGKTVGQVILRWNVQRGVVVIPKSTHKERIEENIDIWDFMGMSKERGEKN